MAAKKCASPRSQGVKSYLRAKRKRKPKAPASYYVAENEHGHTCGHKHQTMGAARACARSSERHYAGKYGKKSREAGTWLTAKRTTK